MQKHAGQNRACVRGSTSAHAYSLPSLGTALAFRKRSHTALRTIARSRSSRSRLLQLRAQQACATSRPAATADRSSTAMSTIPIQFSSPVVPHPILPDDPFFPRRTTKANGPSMNNPRNESSFPATTSVSPLIHQVRMVTGKSVHELSGKSPAGLRRHTRPVTLPTSERRSDEVSTTTSTIDDCSWVSNSKFCCGR